jgi:hypothetical protein
MRPLPLFLTLLRSAVLRDGLCVCALAVTAAAQPAARCDRACLEDPERGLAFAFFDNGSGDARNGTLADGRKVVSGPSVPWTWQIAEVFKIERGKIGPVESVLHQVPYGMGSGWSTLEEAMSSRAR